MVQFSCSEFPINSYRCQNANVYLEEYGWPNEAMNSNQDGTVGSPEGRNLNDHNDRDELERTEKNGRTPDNLHLFEKLPSGPASPCYTYHPAPPS